LSWGRLLVRLGEWLPRGILSVSNTTIVELFCPRKWPSSMSAGLLLILRIANSREVGESAATQADFVPITSCMGR